MQEIVLSYDPQEAERAISDRQWSSFTRGIVKSIDTALREYGCYQKSLCYRGFSPAFFRRAKKYGTDTPRSRQTWCAKEGIFHYDLERSVHYAYVYRGSGLLSKIMRYEDNLAFLVFDPSFFESHTSRGEATLKPGATFKEAAVALVLFIPKT